ncbi:MAG: hypothetical protein AVDCRST_MAG77-3209 [uncultured Chloroflexi bacterium]|uniref:Uncharacterized protein n=1 Tax=uncultured Chloroflexota bacterium TaxID=166587 RepID=A0A6J4JAZ3_9CHLR|nr:MAG: hypothetical protein AVDCRST_MAG77-3209 [uncultured Chloroflexota bacterium]
MSAVVEHVARLHGEERYWIVHSRTSTSIHPDAGGRPARRSLYGRYAGSRRASISVDDLVDRVTAEALARGNLALFRDHWDPRAWGIDAPRLGARAGPLADDFRPRPLPAL